MKSYLTKLFNSSIFCHVQRLMIVCFFCSLVVTASAGTDYYRPAVSVSANPSTGAGSVYVSLTESEKTSQTATANDVAYAKSGEGNVTNFYFYAVHTDANYLWYGWISKNQKKIDAKNHLLGLKNNNNDYGYESKQDKKDGNDTYNTRTYPFTGTWVQPDVTGLTDGTANGTRQSNYTMPTITQPAAANATLTFNLSNDYAGLKDINDSEPASYYSIATALSTNGFVSGALSHTKGSGSLTIPVTYTPTGVHGQTKSDPLVVKSNYPGSGANSWTVVLNVTEDYKPSFTLGATSYNYTPTQPILNNASGTYTLPISGRNYAASNIAEWDVLWSAVTYDGGTAYPNTNPYSVDVTDVNNPKVIFTAPATGTYKDVTAKLTITAKYKDAGGGLIASEAKIITFSADAGEQLTINDERVYTMDFGVIDFGKVYTDEVELISTSSDLDESVNNPVTGITFNADVANEKVVVSIANTTAIGNHTPSLTLSKGALSVVLNVKAQVKLAKPVVTPTTGLGQSIDLSWPAVSGATSYIVKSGETIVATIGDDEPIATTYKVTAIGGKSLVMGTEYPFTVTAVYEPNTFGNRISDEIKVTPTAHTTITSTTEIDIYTGTEIYQEGHATYGKFPYSPKRKIDLSAAFDASGNALFDELYIFGLTTSGEALVQNGKAGHKVLVPNRNADPTNVATTDAIVPCYIYKKINATTYGNLTVVANMNQKAKQIANIKANNQKVYFTGYCPIGSTGFTTGHYGVVCFEQDGEKTLDVYLDNLELHARSQTQGGAGIGKTLPTDTIQKELLDLNKLDIDWGQAITSRIINVQVVQFLESSAAAFAISPTSTSTVFRPTIHLRGENKLNSSAGAIKVTVEMLDKVKGAGQYSSPIHIVTTDANHAAVLAIDDIWPKTNNTTEAALGSSVCTNGGLNLSSTMGGSPSIDLGNAKSGVQFNGGRVRLRNATPGSGSYTVTFAISCRSYNQTASVQKSVLGALVTVNADITLCGMGDDQPTGMVEFNDGTFYSDAIPTSLFNTYRAFYHTRNCVKVPINATVNGGSYYCDIFAASGPKNPGASPKNRYGDGVVLDTIAIDSKTKPYQTANITFPNEKPVRDDFASTYPLTLGAYYTAKGSTYNTNSMQAYEGLQQPDSVILMIPYQYTDKELWEDIRVKNWVMCVPQMGLVTTIDGEETKMSIAGEDVAYVDSVAMDGLPVKTQYLLYAEYDPYIAEAVNSDYYLPDVGLGDENAVELQGDFIQSLKNKGDYQIQTAQYILKPVRGDEWMVFCPPFDVTNVYVLESYPEELLKEMDPYDALIQQAKANIDYLFYPAYYLYINDPAQNFWSFQNIWKANKKLTKGKGAIKLEHFTGKNYAKANYYLQHSSGEWKWDEANAKFKTDWEYLPTTPYKETHGEGKNAKEYNVIMKKGELYSMNFPYMYQGYRDENVSGDPDFAGNWDYWTGKYIIFEGLGQQEIAGKNTHATISADKPQNVDAVLRGNATLSKINVAKNNAYYCNFGEGGQKFTGPYPSTYTEQLSPFSGFVLAGGQIREMPDRKASIDLMSGDVTFENDENGNQNNATGTPTIAGNNKMLVYSIDGGVGIVPVVAQQVRIYNAAGQVVTSQYLTSETQIPLPTGIYLVTGEKEQCKVMVK